MTADADGFEGTVRVVNGKFLAAEVTSDSKMSKYTVITDPSENATALAGIAGTPSGEAVPYADFAAPDAAVEVVGANAVVMGADSVALGDGADVTLAALEKQEVGDYGLWQINGTADKWAGIDGETGFLILPGVLNNVGSAYLKEKFNVTQPWRMTWTFVATKGAGGAWGDGVCFTIQNDAAGAGLCDTACNGGKLGGPCDTTHPLSAAFWWNLYQKESCGWALKGVKGTETVLLNNPTDAQRRTIQGYDLDISYNGAGVMSCRIFYQGEQVYASTQAIDMADVIGGGDENWDGTAYVGFSAASGDSSAFMSVRNVAWAEYTRNSRQAVSVTANAEAALAGTIGGESLGALTLNGGSSLEIKPSAVVPANANYTVAADELRLTGGASTLSIAANGTGSGTLVVGRIVYDGGTVSVSGGNIAVPAASDGVLEVVVADPEFKSRVTLVQFSDGASLNGVTETVVKDAEGNTMRASAYEQNGRLVLSKQRGLTVIFR